jgi:hypothetical protein
MKPSQRCNAVTRATNAAFGIFAPILTATMAAAQSPLATPTLRKLDEEQLQAIERLVLGRAEVKNSFRGATPRVIFGEPELDNAEAQAYLTGERAEPPTATVEDLAPCDSLTCGKPGLARRRNRANLGSIHPGRLARRMESRAPRPGDPASAPNDPCSHDRCLDLIFRGEKSSYLALRADVDLTKQTVALHGRQP